MLERDLTHCLTVGHLTNEAIGGQESQGRVHRGLLREYWLFRLAGCRALPLHANTCG